MILELMTWGIVTVVALLTTFHFIWGERRS